MLTLEEWQAVRLSVLTAMAAVVCSLPFAIAAGWVIAKKEFFGKSVLEVAINLPIVLPPVVTGYLIMVCMGRNGWVGRFLELTFGIRFVFDWKGAVLASAIVSFPLMVRPIKLAFEQVEDRLLLVAKTLGAGPLRTFCEIALPLASSGILAGCVLAFARSIGEFGATILIAGNIPGETQTISLLIYSFLDSPGGVVRSSRLVVASIAIAAMALILGNMLDRAQRKRVQGGNA